MAASPVNVPSAPLSNTRRRPLALTQRRLEANRRNAVHSTGPRTPEGKAKVARNPIKHGFFVARDRWTSQQQRDFEETLAGFEADFRPNDALEESCVRTIAESYVKMAAVLRYENIAALKYHQECERELNQRIAMADAAQAAHLRAERERLRRAGLWRPTIPGPREAAAILRYEGSLNRAIRHAISELHVLKNLRLEGKSSPSKVQKQTHHSAAPNGGPEALRRAFAQRLDVPAAPYSGHDPTEELQTLLALLQKVQKQTHYSAAPNSGPEALRRAFAQRLDVSAAPNSGPEALRRAFAHRFDAPAAPNGGPEALRRAFAQRLDEAAAPSDGPEAGEGPRVSPASLHENAKTNPLTSMFTGNRHQRRRARALAARR